MKILSNKEKSLKNLYKNVVAGIDVRQSLSKLRQELKLPGKREELQKIFNKDLDTLRNSLTSEDAKTRKNTALLIGDLDLQDLCIDLIHGYEREDQLFVKSSYLTGLKTLDYSMYLPLLENRMIDLTKEERTPENKKHLDEELRILSELIVSKTGIAKHEFTGYYETFECVLLTNRIHMDVTREQITNGHLKDFRPAVKVSVDDLHELLRIRTYSELLFVIPGMEMCDLDPLVAAKTVVDSYLLDMLKDSHEGTTPFYFRTEIKSKMPLDKKSVFAKKFSSEIEHLSNRELLNSTSNYELEIRLIENKDGYFNALVKLYTIPDERFSYRQESISSSIKPSDAALLVHLAKSYMEADARVLDPFCGVGTMLIERQMQVKANTSYGIDVLEDAIQKARFNTEEAHQIIHFINRDFFKFTHEHLFDEIFTNMPFAIGRKTEDEIYDLYEQFFQKARDFLVERGTIIMFSHNQDYVQSLSKKNGYTILEEIEINSKKDTYLYIISA